MKKTNEKKARFKLKDIRRDQVVDILTVAIGTLIMMFGFSFFLAPLNLVIGGFMGIVVLLEPLYINTWVAQWMILLILNVISLTLGGLFLGKQFFVRTIFATLLSPFYVFLFSFANAEFITGLIDANMAPLLGAVFGGLLVGLGCGMVVRKNATTGGMDVIQRIFNKYTHIPFSSAVLITDGAVILAAIIIGIVSGNITLGLLGIVSIVVAAVTIDRVAVFGRLTYTVLIVTNKPDEIKDVIYETINRGLTRLKVVGGYTNEDKEMIMCTIYRQQLYLLKDIVRRSDPNSFVLVINTKQVQGTGFLMDDLT